MGEYINHSGYDRKKEKGGNVKVGTCSDCYYATFQDFKTEHEAGRLEGVPGSDTPERFLTENSGYRWRFPFPWEDDCQIFDYDVYNPFFQVPIEPGSSLAEALEAGEMPHGGSFRIVQQKYQDGVLATIVEMNDHDRFRIPPDEVLLFVEALTAYGNTCGSVKKATCQVIANRILNGYIVSEKQFNKIY